MMQRLLHVALAALAGYLLYASSGSLGLAFIAANLFTPLPAAYIGMRHGIPFGAAAVLLTAALLCLAAGPSPAILFLLQFGLTALLLPLFLLRLPRWDQAVAAALLVIVVGTGLGLFVTAILQDESLLAFSKRLVEGEISQTVTYMEGFLAEANLPPSQAAEMKAVFEQTATVMRLIYPGMAVAISGALLLFTALMLNVASRGRYQMPGPFFPEWKTPEPMVWILILAGFGSFFGSGVLYALTLNLLVILLPIYFLQGLAILDCFFRRKALPPFLRGLGFVLVTLVNPLPMILTGVGVFDLWIDFRKPRLPKT